MTSFMEFMCAEFHQPFSFLAANWSGQIDIIRPLKFAQLHGQPIPNLKAANIYTKDIFQIKTNFTERQAMDLFEDERNYGYIRNPVLSVGKLYDTIVDEAGYRKALKALG